MTGEEPAAFECAPGTQWTKDAGQTLVVDPETGRCWTLRGVEAAIWDLLALGYSGERAAAVVADLLRVPADEGADVLARVVHGWAAAGLAIRQGRSAGC